MTLIGLYSDTYSDTYVAGGSGGGVIPARWNPNAPIIAGDEWYGANAKGLPLASVLLRCAKVVATVTENIPTVVPMVLPFQNGLSGQRVVLGADIYDLTVTPATPSFVDTQLWALAVPSSNASAGGSGAGVGKGWQLGGVLGALTGGAPYNTNAWDYVNEVVPANDPLNYAAILAATNALVYSPASANATPIMFNGGATLYDGDTGLQNQSLTGKRVGWVEVVAVIINRLPNGATVDGVITDTSGNSYTSDSGPQSIPGGSGIKRLRFQFLWKPDDHHDWTAQSATNFLNGNRTFGLQVAAQPNAAATGGFVLASIMVQFRVLTERRVAVGYQTIAGGKGWKAITLTDPLTRAVTPWAKIAGHTYLIGFHLTNDGGGANLRTLDSSNVVGHETDALTGLTSASVTCDIGGCVPTAAPVTDIAAMALILGTGAGPSQDSQPYATAAGYGVGATNSVRQLISTEIAATFGAATVLVQSQPDGQGGILEDAPLQVSLRKTSDDSLLSGPASITADDVPPDGKWHAVGVRLPGGAALTAAEPVYLELTSASTVNWRTFAMLTRDISQDASDPFSVQGAGVGIGSTTDYGLYNGVADLTSDYPYSIREVPPILTGLAATVGSTPNIPALTGAYRPATVPYIALSWTASALGAGFARYVVQRLDYATQESSAGVWHTIEQITDENNSYYNDREMPQNTLVLYRVFVVGNPLGQSPIATFSAVQTTVDQCDLYFTSNWNPDGSLGAQDTNSGSAPPRDFTKVPGTGKLRIEEIYGLDKPVAFRQTERGGDAFARRLLIAANDPAVNSGAIPRDRALYDAAIALFGDPTVPYICVTDGYGRRWFATGEVTGISTLNIEGGIATADVSFTEVEGPSTLTTPTPWVP